MPARHEDQDEQPQPSVSSNGTEEISLDELGNVNVKEEKEVIEEEEEVEKTCEVCNVTMAKDAYLTHVLKDHVSEFDVGICQVEKCFPCISKNDGIILRLDPEGQNRFELDDGASDSEESLDGDEFVEILNKDFEDADALLYLYARPGEKLHTDIKYKKIPPEDPGPFKLVKPMAPTFREVPAWTKAEQACLNNTAVQAKQVSDLPRQVNAPQNSMPIQPKQVVSTVGLTPAQRAMIPQIISRIYPSRPIHTYQRKPVPEVIDL